MRKIDAFCHIFPDGYSRLLAKLLPTTRDMVRRSQNVRMLVDLEERFRLMDGYPGYQQILSQGSPPIESMVSMVGPADAIDLARAVNDGMAEVVARHPDRFPGFAASLPMHDGDAAVREAERAFTELGAKGVQIFSNVAGRPLDEPAFRPIFDLVAARDLPILLHPARAADFPDYKAEPRSKYEIWWTFGWPYETSAAMARIVFAGLFEIHPALKILTHHMGAMVPYFAGRVGPGWDQLGKRTSDEDFSDLRRRAPKRPIDYFRMFYADTALFGSFAATECGLDFFGVDRVLFASDLPFDPEGGWMFVRETIEVIDRLKISEDDRSKIYWRNAVRLFRL